MVTKPECDMHWHKFCSVLAKILMVTKLPVICTYAIISSVLAKILMVTKLHIDYLHWFECSVLAKILMVTKQSS